METIARKKYIVVTPFFPEAGNFRGAFFHDQVKAIRSLTDYDVIIYRPLQPWQSGTDYEYDGFTVRWFKAALTPSHILSGIFNIVNGRIFYNRLSADGIRPDDIAAVHCHTAPCGAYGLELKKKNPKLRFLLQHHDLDPYNIRNGAFADNRLNLLTKVVCNRTLFEKVDTHICVSNAVKKQLLIFPDSLFPYDSYLRKTAKLKRFKGNGSLHTYVLYNGVDTGIYNRGENIGYGNNDSFVIGCVGNFIDCKSQIDLIKAVECLHNEDSAMRVRVKFVGSGPTLDSCKRYVSEHNLNEVCSFIPEMPHDTLPEFYRSLDLFCLPSWFEGFGCVFTEAFACGTPYLICHCQGASEYIPDEQKHIWEFTPHDCRQLADRIKFIYENRPIQKLQFPVDINILVADMLKSEELYE